ncbi:MAG: L,D-transpeptidase [Alphaproteobacteria bacterium]|nr:L,D-transpeptidase [Alphaproteobacteria bacterium]MCB1551064.1 L,D-transpeptidase [Alphaproteobacteria bacterium]MCB9984800.1 L,D-transpeptidase [Micavibrio sp.]HRK97191.1 L,D-transpeptidase [Alphaproteobacteria bacterium]
MHSKLRISNLFIFMFCGLLLVALSACEVAGSSLKSNLKTNTDQAVSLHVPPSPIDEQKENRKVDYIVVQKKDWLLSLWKDGRVLKTYSVMAMGANPVGPKVYEGDERTPEGQYYINDKHVSQNFQKFLGISYPSDKDILVAKRFGISPGGQVGIHGDRGGVSGFFQRSDKNWTDGCLALRNKDIEDIYSLVDVGTPILIKP